MSRSNLSGASITKGQSYWVELGGYFRPDWSYDVAIVDNYGGTRWMRTLDEIQTGLLGFSLQVAFRVEDTNPSITSGSLSITVTAREQSCYIPALADQMVDY